MTRDQLLTDAKTIGLSLVKSDGDRRVRRLVVLSTGCRVLHDAPDNLLEKFIKDATEYSGSPFASAVARDQLRNHARRVYQTLPPGETADRLKDIRVKYFGVAADKQMRQVEHRLIANLLQAIETHAAMTAPYDSNKPLVLIKDVFLANNSFGMVVDDDDGQQVSLADGGYVGVGSKKKIGRPEPTTQDWIDNATEMLRRELDIVRADYAAEVAAFKATIAKKDEEIAKLREDAAQRAANLFAAIRRGR